MRLISTAVQSRLLSRAGISNINQQVFKFWAVVFVLSNKPAKAGIPNLNPNLNVRRRDGLAGVLIVLAAVNVIVRRVRYLANVDHRQKGEHDGLDDRNENA